MKSKNRAVMAGVGIVALVIAGCCAVLLIAVPLVKTIIKGFSEGDDETVLLVDYLSDKYPDDVFGDPRKEKGCCPWPSKEVVVNRTVTSQEYPQTRVRVSLHKVDGRTFFEDDYLGHKYETETVAWAEQQLSNLRVGSVKLMQVVAEEIMNDFTSETTFDEYINEASLLLKVVVLTDEPKTAAEQLQSAIKPAFGAQTNSIYGNFYFTSSQALFEDDEGWQNAVMSAQYLDLPQASFVIEAGELQSFTLTHMD